LNYPQNPPPANPYTDLEVNHFMFSTKKITNRDYIIKNRDENEIAINSIIRFICEKYNFSLIDLNKAFAKSTYDSKELFQIDYYHPSEKGDEVIADAIFNFLEKK